LRHRHLIDPEHIVDAGAVDGDVDAVPGLERPVDGCLHRLFIADVAADGDRPRAGPIDRHRRAARSFLIEIDAGDARSSSGQATRGRLAQATAGAGDECDLLRQLVFGHAQTPCVCMCGCRVVAEPPPARAGCRAEESTERPHKRSS
jgi:hypothetical protein